MTRRWRTAVGRRKSRAVTIGRHSVPVQAGVAIYEIEGRVIVRTVDWTDGPSVEREEPAAIDGYPNVDSVALGELVASTAARARRMDLPDSWPTLPEHARPLLDESPRRHRSFRSWQRRARHVDIAVRKDGVHLTRLHPDLRRGAWLPAPAERSRHTGFPQSLVLHVPTDVGSVGGAVLDLLREPPISE